MFDDMDDIADWLEELTLGRHMIVYQRALQVCGYDYTISAGGMIDPCDPDNIDWPALNEERKVQYRTLCLSDTIAELVEDGLVRSDGVDPETGEVIYAAVEDEG